MFKTSPQLAGTLPAIGVDDRKIVGSSSGNDGKSAKSDFTKRVREAEEPSFLTPNARSAFTQLRQAFTKVLILRYFNFEYYI